MLKNFKSRPIIKTLGLKSMLLVIKFSLIANISKPNKTGSWKQSFLDYFKSFIQLKSKFTS